MDQDRNKPPPPADVAPCGARTEVGDAFDLWLQRSLHELYDGVTQEPIPAELLRLIAEDRNRRSK